MLQKIFTVYDSKVGAYLPPFFMSARGEALRAFVDTISDDKSVISKHPEDYTLFELGEYDNLTAKFDMYETPVSLGVAIELIPSRV